MTSAASYPPVAFVDSSAYFALAIPRDQHHADAIAIRRDEARAWEIIDQYSDKRFSFVDATSFAVMERRSISAAFAFDDDFRQYGWQVLSP